MGKIYSKNMSKPRHLKQLEQTFILKTKFIYCPLQQKEKALFLYIIISKQENKVSPSLLLNIKVIGNRPDILGFTMQIRSKFEWGSTSTVLMFMLYWREQMIGNCTYLL